MAIAVTLVVYAMNMVFLGWGPLEAERLGRVFVSGGPVAALVTLLVHMVLAPGSEGLDQSQSPKTTRLMERLPGGRAGPFNIWQQKIITPVSQRPKAAALCCCGSLTRCRTWPQRPACKCTALIGSAMTPLTKPSAEETLRS